ncbi:MAG: hypothetical protein ABII18_10585 [bacterium]|nr:hypothetical protein [bacterium]
MNTQPVTLLLHSLAFQQGYQANHFLPRTFLQAAQQAIETSSYDISSLQHQKPQVPEWKSMLRAGFHKAHTLARVAAYQAYKLPFPCLVDKAIDATRISARYLADKNPEKGKLWLNRATTIAQQLIEEGSLEGLELFAGLQLFSSPNSDLIDKFDKYITTCDEEYLLFTLDAIDHDPADHLQVFLSKIEFLVRKADALIDLAFSTQDQTHLATARTLYTEAFEICEKALEDFKYEYKNAESEITWAIQQDRWGTYKHVSMRNNYRYLQRTLKSIIQSRQDLFEE